MFVIIIFEILITLAKSKINHSLILVEPIILARQGFWPFFRWLLVTRCFFFFNWIWNAWKGAISVYGDDCERCIEKNFPFSTFEISAHFWSIFMKQKRKNVLKFSTEIQNKTINKHNLEIFSLLREFLFSLWKNIQNTEYKNKVSQ